MMDCLYDLLCESRAVFSLEKAFPTLEAGHCVHYPMQANLEGFLSGWENRTVLGPGEPWKLFNISRTSIHGASFLCPRSWAGLGSLDMRGLSTDLQRTLCRSSPFSTLDENTGHPGSQTFSSVFSSGESVCPSQLPLPAPGLGTVSRLQAVNPRVHHFCLSSLRSHQFFPFFCYLMTGSSKCCFMNGVHLFFIILLFILYDRVNLIPRVPSWLKSQIFKYSLFPFVSAFDSHMHSCFSHVQLCETPWTVAHQAPLFIAFSR